MNPNSPRQLERGHFAFMRAIAQGLDERASWDRYLQMEGDHADMRTVRRTIAWIRDAFAAAARREARPGTARLILLDPKRLPQAPVHDQQQSAVVLPAAEALPTLEAFAAASGMEDFSEEEQLEAYAAAYPPALRHRAPVEQRAAAQRVSRRARLIARQLEALRWLEDLVAQDPKPGDEVAAWLNPTLAQRLERAGLPTLQLLLARVNGVGARWWLHVPGVGATKARRIVDWLRAHEGALGIGPGAHVDVPRAQVPEAVLASVVPGGTALLPFEKFIVPPALDGRQGGGRTEMGVCRIAAATDREAVQAWLAAQRPDAAGVGLSATQRAYRREAERLQLWSVLERGQAMSALGADDVRAYQAFLAAPPAHWCGPRHHQRWSPLWRPLEGALALPAQRHAIKVLRSLYAFWARHGYIRANPFAEAVSQPPSSAPFGAHRMLSFAQWDHLNDWLDRLHADERGRRLRRAVRWLYATGMRLSELARVRCADIARTRTGWQLTVRGEGAQHRVLQLPQSLVDEFEGELVRHGFEPSVGAIGNARVAVMARFTAGGAQPPVWSASGIYQAIKLLVNSAAQGLDAIDPVQA
ncbi:MAG: phage integrase family protein, partial [Pseudomonadota bacterium]